MSEAFAVLVVFIICLPICLVVLFGLLFPFFIAAIIPVIAVLYVWRESRHAILAFSAALRDR